MSDFPDAPRTRREQFAFLRAAHDGDLRWRARCLELARTAPGLPAVYPSALSAALATPAGYRVERVGDLRRGMVAYFDDPNDGNPYGHVVTVAGWTDGAHSLVASKRTVGDLLVWSNDAARTGGVDLVAASFFPARWGDSFQFGATCLNGYDLPGYQSPDPEAPAKPMPGRDGKIGPRLDHAIDDLQRLVRRHRAKGHTAIVTVLAADLAVLRETRKRYPR